PRNFHVLALIASQSEVDFAAWVTRLRQPRRNFQREQTDQGRRNLVIHESLSGRQGQRTGPARGTGEGCEIAPKHGRCWNVRGILRRIGALNGSLISAKEEQLVLHDGPAERSSKLVSLQRVAFGRKEISRVENSIPYKFKRIAVKVVRTRL